MDGSSKILTLQPSKVNPITAKYLTGSHFFLILIYFPRTPLAHVNEPAVCGLIYLVNLFLSYLSHPFIYFNETCVTIYLCILYKQSDLQAKITTYINLLQSLLYTAE